GSGLELPVEPAGARHVWYVYAVRSERRDNLAAYLKERGIDTVIHYPLPIHLQKAFAPLGYGPGDFPVAERAAEQVLSLPLCADITEDEVRQVCAAVRRWAGR
ncbi:DegT/DnrJ/EryC1/StrS family aminotransferase, partial [bacterium]|nr:DegT/DnrJ/EryC1/StrS family aminotransferase [bacterium]